MMLHDKLKNKSRKTVLREIQENIICVIPGCRKEVTTLSGPGQTCCVEHQLKHAALGGPGHLDRAYTFHKKDKCERCAWSPFTDPELLTLPTSKKWAMLHAHHIELKHHAHDTVDYAENIMTLDERCHIREHDRN